ncbi:MAG: CCA tRNA nucleotidyltransferase, partial [Candidatus Aenigmarchaeota archaeon]|nr:CCA tRNA nucleotidyltransferase [Candidatus Aenigmarchaeota archaeon]
EHPYVKGKIREFSIDIVPCYKVKSAANIKSAVDRTPFHNRYITSNLKPRMSDDVRLLKQLCKATDIYGSDVKTMGFSGYLCELLIINYKTFKSLINNAKKWKTGTFIDIENRFDLDDPKSFFEKEPLIVIDPTDPRRNVSAALSVENFAKFVNVCSDFSKSPSEKMFEIDRRNISRKTFNNYMKKRGTQMFAVKFNRPNVVDDVLWSQMRRTTSRLVTLANEYEFKVFSNSVWSDEKQSILLLEMKTWNLSETQRLIGPPVASKKHADEFINKYGRKNIYTEGDKWAVTVKRKYRDFDKLLKDFLSRSNKKLLDDGIRSHIAKSMHKKFNVMKNDDIAKFIDNTSFSIFLRKYFERRA